VGITFCPGKKSDSSIGNGRWERDLELDLQALAAGGWQYMVTLVEGHELTSLGVENLGARTESYGIGWIHYPIIDGGAPSQGVGQLREQLKKLTSSGKRVLVHCKGGLGRAGTVATMMLMDGGIDFCVAITMVRAARQGAVETVEQLEFLASLLEDDEED
jgi:ADP-ribosyl-[dinitrogen reductase] hydrolase